MDNQYSQEVNKILKYAENLAYTFNHYLVGSEHLLLGLLKSDNILSQELNKLKVTYSYLCLK